MTARRVAPICSRSAIDDLYAGGMTGPTASSPVVAVTADDDRYATTRREATRFAKESRARLVLYDWDAATVLGDPLPSEWSGQGAQNDLPPELTIANLEAAGRDGIARQVADAQREGLEAAAWLPSKPGADALLAFARERGAGTVFIPADLKSTGLLEHVSGGDSAHDVADGASSGTRIVVVGDEDRR